MVRGGLIGEEQVRRSIFIGFEVGEGDVQVDAERAPGLYDCI